MNRVTISDLKNTVERLHSNLMSLENRVSSLSPRKTGLQGVRIMRLVALMSGPNTIATSSGIRVDSMAPYSYRDEANDTGGRDVKRRHGLALAIIAGGCLTIGGGALFREMIIPDRVSKKVDALVPQAMSQAKPLVQLAIPAVPASPHVQPSVSVAKNRGRPGGQIIKSDEIPNQRLRDATKNRDVLQTAPTYSDDFDVYSITRLKQEVDPNISSGDATPQLERVLFDRSGSDPLETDWMKHLSQRRLTEVPDEFIR
ncbi:hypothetical protein [Burkholderia ubonensis]|uniref:hypothetical protein n=1 Tax=Burkholderia ubonensis TaxID=101571 RepID=UPI0012FB4B4E|nr:hypothetical protein [Burkholderia ubonensis]